MKKYLIVLLMAVILLFAGCQEETPSAAGDKADVLSESETTGIDKLTEAVDYGNEENWLALPESTEKDVDVIYFYPTAYSRSGDSEDLIADVDNAGMRSQAQLIFEKQATVFSESCNIYAPYYRQVDGGYALTVSDEDNETLMRYLASADPAAALDYYFENENQGRPFILAGHSQGSEILTMILADYMAEHPEYYENMVAAYVIGYAVTQDYLAKNAHLKFAEGETDTGVIVSYNTEGPGNAEAHNAVVKDGAVSINPLNWKLDDTYAGIELNKGSLKDDGTIGPGIADAQVNPDRGVVVCGSVDSSVYGMPEEMAKLFGNESYHGSDYSFYYANLQENIIKRIAAYLAQ